MPFWHMGEYFLTPPFFFFNLLLLQGDITGTTANHFHFFQLQEEPGTHFYIQPYWDGPSLDQTADHY